MFGALPVVIQVSGIEYHINILVFHFEAVKVQIIQLLHQIIQQP